MRVLVCGTRRWPDASSFRVIQERIQALPRGSVVIHGAAPGVDSVASSLHCMSGGGTAEAFPADWRTHGRRAGPLRNQQMLDEGRPDLVLAFHTDPGLGLGTRDMVRRARAAGVPVEIIMLPVESR